MLKNILDGAEAGLDVLPYLRPDGSFEVLSRECRVNSARLWSLKVKYPTKSNVCYQGLAIFKD